MAMVFSLVGCEWIWLSDFSFPLCSAFHFLLAVSLFFFRHEHLNVSNTMIAKSTFTLLMLIMAHFCYCITNKPILTKAAKVNCVHIALFCIWLYQSALRCASIHPIHTHIHTWGRQCMYYGQESMLGTFTQCLLV